MQLHPKRVAFVAALASTGALAGASSANAATSTFLNNVLTVSGDDVAANLNDAITLTVDAATGRIFLNNVDTTAPALGGVGGGTVIVVNAGDGNDTVNASALANGRYTALTINGGAGDDLLTGGAGGDTVIGDAGNDRVIGGPNPATSLDTLLGGDGNDQLVWNNGDGTDIATGDNGNDEVEVNGAPTAGDVFTLAPADQVAQPGVAIFKRDNLVRFTMTITAERLTVNGLGGADTFAPEAGVAGGTAALTSVTLNGGSGADALTGTDGADVVNGGEDIDTLDGGAGDDRIAGDRGNDAMSGGAGDDVLVWNNGDATDTNAGGAGFDRAEVNGAGAGDVSTLTPNGAGVTFTRTNLVPFAVAIDAATEAVTANSLGGNDTLTISPGISPTISVVADGGIGDDTIVGGDEADSLFGSDGNDTLTGGAGVDLIDGGDGDDTLMARDTTGDLVRGGAGADRAQTDATTVDLTSGVETLDATAIPAPPTPPAVDRVALLPTLGAFKVVRSGKALVARVVATCPAGEAGGCQTTLTLQTAKAVKLGRLRAVALLGSKSVKLAAGQQATVSIKLAGGAAVLARRGKLAARVSIASSDASGNVATRSVPVGLKIPRR
jgi:Ca2+-binding RTX toxin-like protein